MARKGRGLALLVILTLSVALIHGEGGRAATPAEQAESPRFLTDPVPNREQSGVRWFAATGHTLRGAFLDYWETHGGLTQFGYPITEEFAEPEGPDNKTYIVQYFERNRFEHHPENAGTPYEVLLGTLGRTLTEGRENEGPFQRTAPMKEANTRYFVETGHNIRNGVFLTYWNSYDGLPVHGFPLSEAFEEKSPTDSKSYTVQYFERSRLEYHPEHPGTPYEMMLGLLGTQLAQMKGYPYGWYPPYGHAADFSWISGQAFDEHRKRRGCLYVAYEPYPMDAAFLPRDTDRVMPYGPDWSVADKSGLISHGKSLVIFGQRDSRLALTEQPSFAATFTSPTLASHHCSGRYYWVEHVQANPAR